MSGQVHIDVPELRVSPQTGHAAARLSSTAQSPTLSPGAHDVGEARTVLAKELSRTRRRATQTTLRE